MAGRRDIEAGRAYIRGYFDDNMLTRGLRRAEVNARQFVRSFGTGGRTADMAWRRATATIRGIYREANRATTALEAMVRAGKASIKAAGRGIKKAAGGIGTAATATGGALLKGGGALLGAGALAAAPLIETTNKARQVKQSLGDLAAGEMDAVLRGTDLLSARFGSDLPKDLEAVRGLMQNFGLSAAEATETLVAGYEAGLNKSDDLADTLNEYSPLFREMGLNAQQSLELLNSGMEAGARNTDFVADAVKEFNIRLREAGTVDTVEKIDGDLAGLVRSFQDGSLSGQEAISKITQRLGEIDDPIKRRAAGVAVFGTKFEDLGEKAVLALGKTGAGSVETAGAIDKASEKVESFGEGFARLKNAAGRALLPIIDTVMPLVGQFVAWIETQKALVRTVGVVALALGAGGVAVLALGGTLVFVGTIISGGIGVVGAIGAAIGFLATPVGIAIAAIAGIAGGVVYFMHQAGLLGEAVDWLKDQFGPLVEAVQTAFASIKRAMEAGNLAGAAKALWATLKVAWTNGVAVLMNVWEKLRVGSEAVFAGIVANIKTAWATAVATIGKGLLSVVAGGKILWADFTTTLVNGMRAAAEGILRAIGWALDKLGLDGMKAQIEATADGLQADRMAANRQAEATKAAAGQELQDAEKIIDDELNVKKQGIAADLQASVDGAMERSNARQAPRSAEIEAAGKELAEVLAEVNAGSARMEQAATAAEAEAKRKADARKAENAAADANRKRAGTKAGDDDAKLDDGRQSLANAAQTVSNSAALLGTKQGATALVRALTGRPKDGTEQAIKAGNKTLSEVRKELAELRRNATVLQKGSKR